MAKKKSRQQLTALIIEETVIKNFISSQGIVVKRLKDAFEEAENTFLGAVSRLETLNEEIENCKHNKS